MKRFLYTRNTCTLYTRLHTGRSPHPQRGGAMTLAVSLLQVGARGSRPLAALM